MIRFPLLAWLLQLMVCVSARESVQSTSNDMYYNTLIQRHLEDGGNNNAYFEYDLNDFSLRFDHCQYVKMFDEELAGDEDADTPLAVRYFVVFRLCPTDECSTCNSIYGKYVMEVDEYLQATVQEQANQVEYICGNCQEECDEDGRECTGCGIYCSEYQNMEANGYVNAANYLECQQVQMNSNNNDNEDDNEHGNDAENQQRYDDQIQLFIGPRCSSNGDRIMLGLFEDEYCLIPYTALSAEDVLGYNISYQLLSHTYDADGTNCLSCKENVDRDEEANNQADGNDQQDADDVNEMCEQVYNRAAKCESIYGIDGFVQSDREDKNLGNQAMNEVVVCEYIDSLLANSYTETGDIVLVGDSVVMFKDVTPLQKTTFWLLSASMVCLMVVAFLLQRQIDRTYPQIDLACQSDVHLT
ncbi:hypothetical protein IV203_037801 [Nitzschia inconspicua]|uniref:Uncharacterized protein n=1 Tax=Nitzschia inconspicua TaxID=303405 RepID=A0A9K3LMN5_9STRA|nr:hypothetical protein IV203_037801 [Nitzschia inconspicua]